MEMNLKMDRVGCKVKNDFYSTDAVDSFSCEKIETKHIFICNEKVYFENCKIFPENRLELVEYVLYPVKCVPL